MEATGPKTVKVFANRTAMGFENAAEEKPDQQFVLMPKDYGQDLQLAFVRFQHVSNVSVSARNEA